ncbi:MAG: ATP-binding cassette domain-containing protein [Cyanobacteria bacterium]|jgi:ABC-type polysaccharide/polyol phosphate transport system ATPase subunit|nr:ATP-binding cassette domain-containing protein [Cyanobacteria bacterium GSL.Bin1]
MKMINLKDIYLWRRTQEEFSYDLKTSIFSLLQRKYRKPSKKLILEQVNLEISAGEKVGIIGANGSGKSTLLKLICGILLPTRGIVRVAGNIAPLIELGAGFDAGMSVTDNIIMYGVMLGFSRQEMFKRIQPILEFAELEEYAFIPVKALSSGMKARLGFAIATDVRPDILLLDEVLSVGDARFKQKCRKRIEKFWEMNVTILVVSHDSRFLQQWCQRGIWLEKGRIKFSGDIEAAIQAYNDSLGISS